MTFGSWARVVRSLVCALAIVSSAAYAQTTVEQDWTTLDQKAEQLYTGGDLNAAIRIAKLAVDAATGPAQSSRSMDRLGFFEYTAGNLKDA